MTYTITRKIEIDAGHRIPLHESKCKHLHGHRYVIEASVIGGLIEEGSETGMVKDFGFLKQLMVEEIDHFCDHVLILSVNDPLLPTLAGGDNHITEIVDNEGYFYTEGIEDIALYIINEVPTAENLAEHWFNRLDKRMVEGAKLMALNVWETPNCRATYVRPLHTPI